VARQVLPIVGAIVGAYFGNPQLGYAIGAIIGNAVDPQVIKTPTLDEIPSQGAGEGGHRQVVYGTSLVNKTNIIDFSEVQRVKHRERQGKGGGPIVESERFYRTYAIGLGEPMDAVLMIRVEGKIVYDVREGSQMLAESYDYQRKTGFRFYSGAEDQLPDPDLEALPHNGVGNTPHYRGTSYIVWPNADLTDRVGRIPTIEVEGTRGSVTGPSIAGGWIAGPVTLNGAAGGSMQYYQRADTPEELPAAPRILAPIQFTKISKAQNGALFMYSNSAMRVSFDGAATWEVCSGPGTTFGTVSDWEEVTWNGHFYYHKIYRSADGKVWEAIPGLPVGTSVVVGREFFNNPIVAIAYAGGSGPGGQIHLSFDDGATWEMKRTGSGLAIGDMTPGHLYWRWTENSTQGRYSGDNFATVIGEPTGFVKYRPYYSDDQHQSWMRKTFDKGIIFWDGDPPVNWEKTLDVQLGANDDNSVAWGDHTWVALRVVAGSPPRAYININREGGAPDDPVLGPRWSEVATPLYGNLGNIVHVGALTYGSGTHATTTLQEVIEDIFDRCGLEPGEYDLSELDDVFLGVTLGGEYTGAGAATMFMPAFFFDLVQPEKQIIAVRRGGAVKMTITADHFVEEPDESMLRGQDIEYPRLLQLRYLNRSQNYAAPAARAARTSPDVRVRGEATMDLPISLTETEAHRIADRVLKVMWEDLAGEVVVSLPAGPFAWLTPTDTLGLSIRGALYRIRADRVEQASRVLKIKARRDRQSAYTSNLTPMPLPAPTQPPPSIVGPTKAVLMNLPGLTDETDALGLYAAVAGEEGSAWYGATVQYSIDGGATWIDAIDIGEASTIGWLASALPQSDPAYPDDTNSITIVLEDDTELETLSEVEFLSEKNALALMYGDGTAEILQFRYATDLGNRAWLLSGFLRGRLNTVAGPHTPGGRVVLLSTASFVPLPSSLIGETLDFRFVSMSESPELAQSEELTWEPVVIQTEFPAAQLALARSGGIISGSWIERGRFGTDITPIASINFEGWRVTLTAGAVTQTFDVATPSFSVSDAAFSGSITVTVAQLNRYTGAGPSISKVI
jgi:hypothetical protein